MTELLYTKDFDIVTCNAVVTSVGKTENGRTDIVLDQTCFYPRGGGQDWDMGEISSGNLKIDVEEVRLDENGNVHHIGTMSGGMFMVGEDVDCSVDTKRRTINTKLHSGGHVVDMAVDSLGLDWIGTKGQHYPELCAVEYSGTWDVVRAEELRASIEQKANDFVKSAYQTSLRFMPVEEMHAICRHVPENIPKNKPGRIVMYGEDFGIPCGGTHVSNLAQIGEVKVSRLKEKNGVIRLNYEVVGINA
ncbi:MAG: alanine--tRNA ligase-related protein [Candidatus Saccharibacteria bacterium]|nr:alanine--tRNA ligase-related protein [Candidatus Saccharibacteria bacterium]